MPHSSDDKSDSPSDPMPRDPKLPPTQLLQAPEEREEEVTAGRQLPESTRSPRGEALGDGATLDESGEVEADDLEEIGEESGVDWDETTVVDGPPRE